MHTSLIQIQLHVTLLAVLILVQQFFCVQKLRTTFVIGWLEVKMSYTSIVSCSFVTVNSLSLFRSHDLRH